MGQCGGEVRLWKDITNLPLCSFTSHLGNIHCINSHTDVRVGWLKQKHICIKSADAVKQSAKSLLYFWSSNKVDIQPTVNLSNSLFYITDACNTLFANTDLEMELL